MTWLSGVEFPILKKVELDMGEKMVPPSKALGREADEVNGLGRKGRHMYRKDRRIRYRVFDIRMCIFS